MSNVSVPSSRGSVNDPCGGLSLGPSGLHLPSTDRDPARHGLHPAVWGGWEQTVSVAFTSSRHFAVCCRHVGTASGGLSRRIRSTMFRKSHRGTATAAIKVKNACEGEINFNITPGSKVQVISPAAITGVRGRQF